MPPMHRAAVRSVRGAGPTFAIVAASLWAAGLAAQEATPPTAVRWWEAYQGDDVNGPDVLGYWKLDGEGASALADASPHGHTSTLRGGKLSPAGRFGGCLESSAGYPVVDESHGLHITRSPVLSPPGPFTAELWVRAKGADDFPANTRPVLLDMKYVTYNHTGFKLSLSPAGADGARRLTLELGTGTETHHWYSRPFLLPPANWRHLAFTYDARGTAAFFVDGKESGRSTIQAAGPMAAAVQHLAIGDRIGSLYNGFPGYLDEVRITRGVRAFRPIRIVPLAAKFATVRMTDRATLEADLINQTGQRLESTSVRATIPDGTHQTIPVPPLAPGASHRFKVLLPTSLRPGEYALMLTCELPGWGGTSDVYQATTRIPFVITARPLPARMPVVMWGIGGVDEVVREIPRLKQLGFTHCLGLRCDYGQVWEEGGDALPGTAETIRNSRDMLDAALAHDIGIVASLSPGSWLRRASVGKPFLRVDRQGGHYRREDVSGLFPRVGEFSFDTGAAMARAYGDHPAFRAALLHTEVRGESEVSFHPLEVAAYQRATGREIPQEVKGKNGVSWQQLADFPADRVIADDHPILQYLTWFWTSGDGWNQLNTQLHQGLTREGTPDRFWTFHDPAVRQPSIRGSGGRTNVLSHWTYSYPDPVRIGLCTDELFEMARVNGHGQDVMKMTQIIWYRSQTAPRTKVDVPGHSPWVDQDPDADYITIAPLHLREAFWAKIARPIQGIMYHGWQSLVPTETPGAYRYTNPNTQFELQRLIREVVEPLGPMLRQVPDAPAEVAFLESFTSQMFARRGTYGWNGSWAGDMYHILMYSQLQPRVLYEESLLAGGLESSKILVLADCDVLTESVVARIQAFQAQGGLIIGDAQVCPAIKPDLVIPRFARSKQAAADRAALLAAAARLRGWLDSRHARPLDSTNPNVVTRRRRAGTTDYVFAVNDHREAGTYVGDYGLVMENGLPSETVFHLRRDSGFVYDLRRGRPVPVVEQTGDRLQWPYQLGPCDGGLFMVTQRPIKEVQVRVDDEVELGDSLTIEIEVTDGRQAIDAVVPIDVRLIDPEAVEAEFSGYYGAKSGRQTVTYDVAGNDRTGVWTVMVRDLAAGNTTTRYVRVLEKKAQ